MKKILILSILSIIVFSCKNNTEDATNLSQGKIIHKNENVVSFTPEQIKTAGIKTGKLKKMKISQEIYATGVIEILPDNMIEVSAPSSAFIKKILIKHGAYVKKGQTVIILSDNEFIDIQSGYLTLKNELELKKQEYNRQKKLFEEKAVSEKKFKQVEAEYNIALTKEKALEGKLLFLGINPKNLTPDNISSEINLKAPISGYVDEIYANSGRFVESNEVLFKIINPSGYNIMLNVYGKYRNIIKVGDKVIFRPCQDCEKRIAEIYSIGHIIDEKTKTFRVHATPNKSDNLMLGAFINAKILINNGEIYGLPKNAVIEKNEKTYVFVKKSDTDFEQVEVKIGHKNDAVVGIINIDSIINKEIVIEGANYLFAKLNE